MWIAVVHGERRVRTERHQTKTITGKDKNRTLGIWTLSKLYEVVTPSSDRGGPQSTNRPHCLIDKNGPRRAPHTVENLTR